MDTSPDSIPSEQIAYKKKVGTLKGGDVIELATKGGLNLIVTVKNKQVSILGCGPHRAVSRHIALKKEPEIQWSDLSKSDYVDEAHYADLLPKYEAITAAFRKAQGIEE